METQRGRQNIREQGNREQGSVKSSRNQVITEEVGAAGSRNDIWAESPRGSRLGTA